MSDIFCAWLGGVPEEREEVKDFLRSSGLSCLLSEHDLAEVFKGNVYFSEETFLAVYALIPVKLKAGGKELVLFPQVFNRLNLKAAEKPSARAVNIGFAEAAAVLEAFYPEKKRYLDANRETLQKDNRKARNKTYSPEKYKLYRASLSEEKKAELREKSRLRMQRLRAENPEKATADARKYWRQMPQEKKDYQRIVSRGRNRKYREENREAIRSRNNERRRRLKEENPELLKEIDRRHNQNANRQQSCREYYLKNKEKIAAKAKENPKVKEYKRRYKLKQRFRNSTGRTILALLQGIADSKAGRPVSEFRATSRFFLRRFCFLCSRRRRFPRICGRRGWHSRNSRIRRFPPRSEAAEA